MAISNTSAQTYARTTGIVLFVAIVAGGFGEAYAPSTLIVAGNAAATAHNLVASSLVFHLGFVAYLGESVTDIALAFLLYVLLRPVHSALAFMAVLFRLMATATFAFGELFYFAPSLILGGASYMKTFSADQLNSLSLLSLNVYSAASTLFNVHYGIASIVFGYLIFRSGYLPRVLGALWVLGGLGFVIGSLVYVFAPAVAPYFVVPQVLAVPPLGLWLLFRGVDAAKWNQRAAFAA